ncbi:MAG: EamA family transporter [Chloroflexi bacterium]|nr:EamA family transporter [Chloroflexota bacterium]
MLEVALGLSAALGFGSSAIFARLGLEHMRSTTGTLASLIVGSIVAMGLALAFHFDEIFALSSFAFVWFLLSAAINFPLGRLLNYTGVSLVGVSRATPIIGASPLFAMALAITVGGESINVPIFLGTVFIIGGLALVLSQR